MSTVIADTLAALRARIDSMATAAAADLTVAGHVAEEDLSDVRAEIEAGLDKLEALFRDAVSGRDDARERDDERERADAERAGNRGYDDPRSPENRDERAEPGQAHRQPRATAAGARAQDPAGGTTEDKSGPAKQAGKREPGR